MLFGHQNDDANQTAQTETNKADQAEGVNPLAVDTETGASLPAVTTSNSQSMSDSDSPVLNQPASTLDDAVVTPTVDAPAASALEEPVQDTVPTLENPAIAPVPDASSDLLGLKQQALTQLSPLLSHLEQTPEERFRTTMMLIQSTDNQALLKDAYEAAQGIGDEKVRAQALLDVVNEINYFTQPKAN